MRVLHVAESIKGGCGTYLNQVVPVQAGDPAISALRVIVPDAHVAQVPDISPHMLRRFARPGRSTAGLAALARAVRSEVAAFRPDVVHLHSTFAGLVGRPLLAMRRHRPRVVYCAHGWAFDMDRTGWKLRAMAAAERLLAPLADRIVAISDHERRRGEAVGIAPARLVVVHNGLSNQSAAPVPAPASHQRLRLLFIGRLDRQKGCDTLLAAVEGLGDQITLDLIGTAVVGDQGNEAGRPWPAHVRALGWCGATEIGHALAAADLVVVPSRWEGFGLVALEAMRAGRAVLASDVGGLPEVVADGVTGRLVPPDDPAALRAALLAFTPGELVAMGAAGRRRFVNHFTVDRTVAGLSALYRDLLEPR